MIKQKVSGFFDKIVIMMNLNAKKIISIYSYVLLCFPIAFFLLISLQAAMLKTDLKIMFKNQPLIAVATIISIIDFMFGYYLLLEKKNIILNKNDYKFIMLNQCICQLLVGNIICAFLAFLGVSQSKTVTSENLINNRKLKVSTIIVSSVLIICFILIIVINI